MESRMHEVRWIEVQLSDSRQVKGPTFGLPSVVLNKSTLLVHSVTNPHSPAHRLIGKQTFSPSGTSREIHPPKTRQKPNNLWGIKSGKILLRSYPIHVSPCYHKCFHCQPQWIVEGSCIILSVFWVVISTVLAFQDKFLFLAFCRGIKATRDHGYAVYSNSLWLVDECDCVSPPAELWAKRFEMHEIPGIVFFPLWPNTTSISTWRLGKKNLKSIVF